MVHFPKLYAFLIQPDIQEGLRKRGGPVGSEAMRDIPTIGELLEYLAEIPEEMTPRQVFQLCRHALERRQSGLTESQQTKLIALSAEPRNFLAAEHLLMRISMGYLRFRKHPQRLDPVWSAPFSVAVTRSAKLFSEVSRGTQRCNLRESFYLLDMLREQNGTAKAADRIAANAQKMTLSICTYLKDLRLEFLQNYVTDRLCTSFDQKLLREPAARYRWLMDQVKALLGHRRSTIRDDGAKLLAHLLPEELSSPHIPERRGKQRQPDNRKQQRAKLSQEIAAFWKDHKDHFARLSPTFQRRVGRWLPEAGFEALQRTLNQTNVRIIKQGQLGEGKYWISNRAYFWKNYSERIADWNLFVNPSKCSMSQPACNFRYLDPLHHWDVLLVLDLGTVLVMDPIKSKTNQIEKIRYVARDRHPFLAQLVFLRDLELSQLEKVSTPVNQDFRMSKKSGTTHDGHTHSERERLLHSLDVLPDSDLIQQGRFSPAKNVTCDYSPQTGIGKKRLLSSYFSFLS